MKKSINRRSLYGCAPKISLKLKLTSFFLLVSLFQMAANTAFSQNTKVTLDLKNVTIKKVLNEIEQKTDFKFMYEKDIFQTNEIVSVFAKKEKLSSVLKMLFKNNDISIVYLDKQIILKLENKKSLVPITPLKKEIKQQKEITGNVVDNEGIPLPGASIVVKGTSIGTTTDFDGNFSLAIPDGEIILEISFIGFITQTVIIGDKTTINITLEEDTNNLQEVILTGYSSERKSDLTGAVAIVDMDDVVNQPVASVDNMLQGRVTGVNVVSNSSPGGASTLRIRGYSTIRNNDPLYIIDGVPTTEGINLINPNDIASLQVLKDASSASIYGSRAANGVVIITTKKGKSEDVKVSFNAYTGIQNVRTIPSVLNAQQYGDVYWDAFDNDGITPNHAIYGSGSSAVIPAFLDADNTIPSSDTKWIDELFDTAIVQSYNLTLAKGGEKSHSLFSMSYFEQEGTLMHSNFNRLTARINSDYKLFNDKVTIGENLTVASAKTIGLSTSSLLSNPIFDGFRIPSIAPIRDINGAYTGYPLSDVENPVGKLERNKDNNIKNVRIFGNIYAEIALREDLTFKTNFGLNYTTKKDTRFRPTYEEPNSQRAVNDLTIVDEIKYDWVWSNIFNYNKTFNDKHTLNVLVGIESVSNSYDFSSATANDFPSNDLNIRVLSAGTGEKTFSGNSIEYSLFSYFGKVNYSYDNKYLFSATVRRDGTSKLLNNRWGTFPAFSAGWKISEEDFFNQDGLFSSLKLRAGWGITGNQDIPAYQTVSGYRSFPNYSSYDIGGNNGSVSTGYTLSRIANPDLKWETTNQFNIGFDALLLNNSLSITVDYFNKKTEDLLLFVALPPDTGGLSNLGMWDNVGDMRNKGFEFAADYTSDRTKDFSYNIGINFSIIDNELISLGEGVDFIQTDSSTLHDINFDQLTSRTSIGQSIASFFGHVVDGVFQSDAAANSSIQPNAVAGDFIFRDVNGDGSITDADRTFIGSPHADFTYGMNFSGNYKNFDFTLFFQGSQGNEIYDLSRYYTDFFNLSDYNKSNRILNAWSPNNTNSDLARISLNDPNNNIRPSSYYVQDGSYLRLKTMQIGYTFPESFANKIKASKFRIYLEAYNLFTITDYKGLDPEIGLQSYTSDDRNLDIGVDRGVYPSSQTFTLGLNLNF